MEEPPRIGAKTESVYIAGNLAPVSKLSRQISKRVSQTYDCVHGEFGAAFTVSSRIKLSESVQKQKGAGILYLSNPEPRVICVNFVLLGVQRYDFRPNGIGCSNRYIRQALRTKEKERKIRGVQDERNICNGAGHSYELMSSTRSSSEERKNPRSSGREKYPQRNGIIVTRGRSNRIRSQRAKYL
jgi:hypothetical protein